MANIRLDTRKLDQLIKQVSEKVPEFIVTDGVDYGIFVEMGMNAQPALIPALDRLTRDLPKRIGEAIEQGGNLGEVMEEFARRVADEYAANVPVDTGDLKDSIHVERR